MVSQQDAKDVHIQGIPFFDPKSIKLFFWGGGNVICRDAPIRYQGSP